MPNRRTKQLPQGFEVVFLKVEGKRFRRHFKSEAELVEHLKNTKTTEAPVSFKYSDGSIIDKATLDRLHRRLFGEEQ